MEAVWKLVNQEKYFEAVIGSGKAYAIKDWIKICFDIAKLDWKKYVIKKEGFTSEYKLLVSDPSIIKSLGWIPKVNIHQLCKVDVY